MTARRGYDREGALGADVGGDRELQVLPQAQGGPLRHGAATAAATGAAAAAAAAPPTPTATATAVSAGRQQR